MRLVTVVLVVLLALIQYPLWWGHGGWLRVHELRGALTAQQQKNADEKLRNERIEGDVQDLQNGTAAFEERARYEMGMVKDGELNLGRRNGRLDQSDLQGLGLQEGLVDVDPEFFERSELARET